MKRRPTLYDVAQKAGVSPKTVARVITGEAIVRPERRARIEAAIEALDYRPNVIARSLASARNYRMAVISPWISAYFIAQMHTGAAVACRRLGYQLAIHELVPFDRGALAEFARLLRDQPLDGVFIPAPLCDDPALLDLLDREAVRYVRHSPLTDPQRSDRVEAEESAAMDKLIGHLWSNGHRRFAIVSGPDSHLSSSLRRDGALAAITRRGGELEAVARYQLPLSGPLFPHGEEAAGRFLALPEPPTAVLCFNDVVAAGVLAMAHRRGVCVPDEMAVAGYGNADFASFLHPSLTTLHQPNALMARIAIEWLAAPPADHPRAQEFPVELVLRNSA